MTRLLTFALVLEACVPLANSVPRSNLYSRPNSFGQLAFTWLADQNVTDFTGDIAPLVQGLATYGGPLDTDYMGYVAFGSETFHADRNATFSVPKLEMDVRF